MHGDSWAGGRPKNTIGSAVTEDENTYTVLHIYIAPDRQTCSTINIDACI